MEFILGLQAIMSGLPEAQLSAFMARLLPDKISSSGVSFNLASRGSDLYI